MKQNLTDISSLGEFGLIDRLTRTIRLQNPETVKGVGDDAAVINNGDQLTVVTKDLLVEGVHFDMVYCPLKYLGYKAVVVNLSDIYAMNARPKQIIVGLAVSAKYSVEAIEQLYAGILLACETYHVDLAGGDTTAGPAGLMISVTAIGCSKTDQLVYRCGAKPNDILCVTGNLGAAYCGLLVLQREKQEFKGNPKMQPKMDEYAYVLERQLKPEARKDIIQYLAKAKVKPTAMIDISDGLASEVLHICKQSNVGATIFEDKIPVDRRMAQTAHEFNIDPATCALSGGEDYELLFSVGQDDYEKIKDCTDISPVGYITGAGQGSNLITASGQQVKLTAQGWDALMIR